MMNGAPTVGAGETVEIAEEAGEENVFLFGLSAEQVAGSRGWYDPRRQYEAETRQALDLIFSGHFNRREPDLFCPTRDALLTHGDYYMHLADLASAAATQSRAADLHADHAGWAARPYSSSAAPGSTQATGRSPSTPNESGGQSPYRLPRAPSKPATCCQRISRGPLLDIDSPMPVG